MSDSFTTKADSNNPWIKMYALLTYRRICRGVWVDSRPADWVKYILDHHIRIRFRDFWDSGGGMFGGCDIEVKLGHYPNTVFYELDSYQESGYDTIFLETFKSSLSYLKTYGIKDFRFKDEAVQWAELFGPRPEEFDFDALLETVRIGYLPEMLDVAITMESMQTWTKSKSCVFRGEAKKTVDQFKQLAWLAFLDMERSNHSGC